MPTIFYGYPKKKKIVLTAGGGVLRQVGAVAAAFPFASTSLKKFVRSSNDKLIC